MVAVNLNTRWSFSSISNTLPSGKDSSLYKIECFLEVYDSASGVSRIISTVIVQPSTASLSLDQVTTMIDSISELSRSTDYKLSVLSALSLTLSTVTCTLTPNCTLLNRQPCELTSNTCGSCIPGYIGILGDSNIACVPEDDDVTSSCDHESDCRPWEVCSFGTCVEKKKMCVNGCSGHGTCSFYTTVTFTQVTSCPITDDECMAVCACETGYDGAYCQYLLRNAQVRTIATSGIISGISGIVDMLGSEVDSMQRLQTLFSLLPSDVSCYTENSIESLLSLSSNVTKLTSTLQIPYESCTGPFNILSIVSKFSMLSKIKNRRRLRQLAEGITARSGYLESLFYSTSEIYASDMVGGQLPVYRSDPSGTQYTFASSTSQDTEISILSPIVPGKNSSIVKIYSPGLNGMSVISFNGGLLSNSAVMVTKICIFILNKIVCCSALCIVSNILIHY